MKKKAKATTPAVQEYEGYDVPAEGYDTGEYYPADYGEGTYYQEEGYEEFPPAPPLPPPQAPAKKGKKKAKKKKKKVRKKSKAAKGKKSQARPLPPPPAYQEEYYEAAPYPAEYPAPYPGEAYVAEEPVVVEEGSMIETVVEEEKPVKKEYLRKTDEPIYSIEEKIDRMLMGRELTLEERFKRKFGEELELEETAPLSTYSLFEEKEVEEKTGKDKSGGKEIVPSPPAPKKKKKKEKKVTAEKKKAGVKKGKPAGKKKPEKKKGGLFGGLIPSAGEGTKKKKSPAELMKERMAARKPSATEKAPPIKKPEVREASEEKGDITIEEFNRFKKMVDDLLGNLPEDVVAEFTSSEEFKLYSKVATAEDFTEHDKEYIRVVDDLLGKLPEPVIRKFTESEDFNLYRRVAEWGSA